jgi:glycosyltransferase involved in cell wall biosynthesis
MTTGVDSAVIVLASRETPGSAAGGIHKAVLGQIAALLENKVRVHLITASYPCAESARAMGATADYSPVWHNSIKPILFPNFWLKLLSIRFRNKPCCVIHHSGRTWFWGHVFFAGIPNIQVFHRELVRPYRFFKRWLTLSPGFAEFLQKNHSLRGWRKISWAPNALLSSAPFVAEASSVMTANKNCFTIGFIGRAGIGKGTDILMQAAAEVIQNGKNLKILCAGDGKAFIETEAARQGISENIDYVGWMNDLSAFFKSIDLLVLPSLKESFGLVLIEAMAAAKPVLATNCHGPASIVIDGITGYLAPIGNATALAEKLLEAIQSPNLIEMGNAGYERVRDFYLPKPVGARLIEALSELGVEFKTSAYKK